MFELCENTWRRVAQHFHIGKERLQFLDLKQKYSSLSSIMNFDSFFLLWKYPSRSWPVQKSRLLSKSPFSAAAISATHHSSHAFFTSAGFSLVCLQSVRWAASHSDFKIGQTLAVWQRCPAWSSERPKLGLHWLASQQHGSLQYNCVYICSVTMRLWADSTR